MLDHLTIKGTQLWSEPELDHLTAQFKTFLLSCKVSGLSEYTLKAYSYQLGKFVHFCRELHQNDAKLITTHHIRLFILKLQETNKPISISDYLKTIRRFFNWLIEEGIIDKSPARNVRLGKLPRVIIKPFSRQDIDNLLLLCSGDRFLNVRNRAIILLFYDTGLRLSELSGIQLKDIDFDRETIKVMGKGAKERRVHIGKTVQKALLRYLLMRDDKHTCLWVTEERRPLTKAGIQVTIKKLCHRAGIKDAKLGPHTFRHTAAINFLRNGGTEFTLQLLLGHSTLQMTRKYVSSLGEEDMLKAHRVASPADNLGIK